MSVLKHMASATALACLALAARPLMAQGLADPTRPPPESMLLSGTEPPPPSTPQRPQLQSVLIGKGYAGREVAVIDGQVVRRGEKVNGAVLVSVSANEVVLRRNGRTEVLKLFVAPERR